MRNLIVTVSIVFVITVSLLTISPISVVTSVEFYFLHIVFEIDKGTHFLFYTYFIKGIDPDCIDMWCNDSSSPWYHIL